MKFEKTYDKDAGPIVRWIATFILSVLNKLEKPLYDYAWMYEVTDWEEDDSE